jgi:hypothetical protein
MGVFYLKHKKHGTKVAIQEEEVEQDKKRGWEEYDPEEPVVVPRETLKKPEPKQATI